MLHKKHFSLKEARKLLSGLKLQLYKMIKLKNSLDEIGYDIYTHQFFGAIGSNGTGKYPEELQELIKIVNDITQSGIVIKGLDSGLIDFPHIRENGEEVYLCYLYGEDDIEFWHSIPDGFKGRKRIEDL